MILQGYSRQTDNELSKTINIVHEQEQTIIQPKVSTIASDNHDNLST